MIVRCCLFYQTDLLRIKIQYYENVFNIVQVMHSASEALNDCSLLPYPCDTCLHVECPVCLEMGEGKR